MPIVQDIEKQSPNKQVSCQSSTQNAAVGKMGKVTQMAMHLQPCAFFVVEKVQK